MEPPAPEPLRRPPTVSLSPDAVSAVTGNRHSVPDIAARRVDIEARVLIIDAQDFFEMLGVPRDVTPEQVQAAYFALAKAWHPDRQPPELVELKEKVARVFARLNEAYQTLSDPLKRADYARALDAGEGTVEEKEKIARVVDAALEFQKAEVLLKKHDLSGAEMYATHAVQADPEQPEYLTLLVWIQAQRRGEPPALVEGRTTSYYDDLIRILDGVLSKEPRYERALFFRGMLLKRAGRPEKALRDFRLAADINPRNLDAVREVRLAEMRRRSGPPERARGSGPQAGGLFGKLFKK